MELNSYSFYAISRPETPIQPGCVPYASYHASALLIRGPWSYDPQGPMSITPNCTKMTALIIGCYALLRVSAKWRGNSFSGASVVVEKPPTMAVCPS